MGYTVSFNSFVRCNTLLFGWRFEYDKDHIMHIEVRNMSPIFSFNFYAKFPELLKNMEYIFSLLVIELRTHELVTITTRFQRVKYIGLKIVLLHWCQFLRLLNRHHLNKRCSAGRRKLSTIKWTLTVYLDYRIVSNCLFHCLKCYFIQERKNVFRVRSNVLFLM